MTEREPNFNFSDAPLIRVPPGPDCTATVIHWHLCCSCGMMLLMTALCNRLYHTPRCSACNQTLWDDTRSTPNELTRELTRVHDPKRCAGQHCCVHNPSQHHMIDWPMHFRSDRGLMERICSHGIGHPDPDDIAYHVRAGRDGDAVHGCDGCCAPPRSAR